MSKVLQINAGNLNNLKNQYNPLNSFYVDENDGTLIFENMKLNIPEISLDEIILMLDINDFRLFIRNGFYKKSLYNDQIIALIQRNQLTDGDYQLINEFAKDIVLRIRLYNRYKGILDNNMESECIKTFLKDTVIGKKIINLASVASNPSDEKSIANVITTLYEKNNTLINTPDEDTTRNDSTQSQDKELVRTRSINSGSLPDYDKWLQDEKTYLENSNKIGTAGFTSILAIIAVIIAFGVYVAVMSIG